MRIIMQYNSQLRCMTIYDDTVHYTTFSLAPPQLIMPFLLTEYSCIIPIVSTTREAVLFISSSSLQILSASTLNTFCDFSQK